MFIQKMINVLSSNCQRPLPPHGKKYLFLNNFITLVKIKLMIKKWYNFIYFIDVKISLLYTLFMNSL